MSDVLRIFKAYHLADADTGEPVGRLATVMIFQDHWRQLTKPQRAALVDLAGARPATLTRLREQLLVDQTGQLTLLGEAVLHYRPDAPVGHAYVTRSAHA